MRSIDTRCQSLTLTPNIGRYYQFNPKPLHNSLKFSHVVRRSTLSNYTFYLLLVACRRICDHHVSLLENIL